MMTRAVIGITVGAVLLLLFIAADYAYERSFERRVRAKLQRQALEADQKREDPFEYWHDTWN